MRALSQGTAWRHTERGGRVTFKRSREEEGGARACACVRACMQTTKTPPARTTYTVTLTAKHALQNNLASIRHLSCSCGQKNKTKKITRSCFVFFPLAPHIDP